MNAFPGPAKRKGWARFMIVEQDANDETLAPTAISRHLSSDISQTRCILVSDYGDMHNNFDIAIRGYQAFSRALRALEETARLSH